jgi:integrase
MPNLPPSPRTIARYCTLEDYRDPPGRGDIAESEWRDIKTIQELLRHSNYKVTADTYTQAVTPIKRAAQTKLVRMIFARKNYGRGQQLL